MCKSNTVKNATCPSHAYKTFLNLAAQFLKVCEEKERERESLCWSDENCTRGRGERGVHLCDFQPPFWLEWLRVRTVSVRRTFGNGLSCFRTARGGRRCCCWAGPEGPNTKAARLGLPTREEGLRMVQACPTPTCPDHCRG